MPRNVFPGYREVMIFQQVTISIKIFQQVTICIKNCKITYSLFKQLGDTKNLQIYNFSQGFSVPRHLWHRVLTGEKIKSNQICKLFLSNYFICLIVELISNYFIYLKAEFLGNNDQISNPEEIIFSVILSIFDKIIFVM